MSRLKIRSHLLPAISEQALTRPRRALAAAAVPTFLALAAAAGWPAPAVAGGPAPAAAGGREPAAAGERTPAASDDESQAWEFRKPTGRITNALQGYVQRIEGLPAYQERLDGELELFAGNGTYDFKAVPWAWGRQPDAQGGLPRQARGYFELKEGWAERTGSWLDVRAGNQIFAWGTADQINPTDVWNPRDLYDPLQSPKLPITALQLKLHPPSLDQLSLEVIATPFFRPSRLPISIPDSGTLPISLNDSRWLLPFPNTVVAGGGNLTAPLLYQVTEATYPSTWQAGARLMATRLGGWDFSASYASVVESQPRFAIARQGSTSSPSLPVTLTLNPSFHRAQMVGLDGAGSITLGSSEIGTRFEGAYFFRDNSRVYEAPAQFQGDLLRDDYVHLVAGIDYTFQHKILGTVLYANLQYVHYQRIGTIEQTPGQFVVVGLPNALPWDRDLVLYLEDRIGQASELKLTANVVASLQNQDGLIAPAIQYGWSDNLKTSLGAEIFAGAASGFFGQFAENSRATFTASYSF